VACTDCVALGTETSNNYVGDVAAGAGLTKSSSAGEGQSVDLAVGAGNCITVGADTVGINTTNCKTNWDTAYTHSQATTNVHGLTFTGEGSGGGLDADTVDSAHVGSISQNYITKMGASTTLGQSVIYDNGSNVGIGTTSPSEILTVGGNLAIKEVSSAPTATSGYGKVYAKNDPYTVLLLHADGSTTSFTDSSASKNTLTAYGGATQSSSNYKFSSGGSASFDGAGDYLATSDSSDWDFGSGNFTIDAWVRISGYMSNATDITPAMSSDTAPSPYNCSVSPPEDGSYPAWRAFDNSIYTVGGIFIGTVGWWKFYFGSNNAKVVRWYKITGYSITTFSPNTWTFQGSNNDIAWTTLDTRTGITWTASEAKTFTLSGNPNAYLYYRLSVSSNNGAANTAIYELELMGTLRETVTSQSSNLSKGWAFAVDSKSLYFDYSTNGTNSFTKSASWSPSNNVWYHVAAVRSQNNLTFYVNGTRQGVKQNLTGVTVYNSQALLKVGARNYSVAANYFNGSIDELRISKGIARWTSNFTMPTQPYDDYGLFYKGSTGTTNALIGGSSGSTSTSYWSQTGSYVYYNSGNVGIGTTSPVSKLDVLGNVSLNKTLYVKNGNVGIGTAAPIVRLTILDVPGVDSEQLAIGASAADHLSIGFINIGATTGFIANTHNSTDTRFDIRIRGKDSTDAKVTVLGSGNVGIGTTAPVSKLDVLGNVSLNKTLYVKNGNVGIGTSAPSQTLDVKGTGGLPAVSGTTQNGNLRIESSVAYGNVLDIGHSDTSPYGLWLQGTDRTNLALTYPLLLNPNGGNVGIGTTTPDQKLKVVGSINITNPGNLYYDGALVPYSPLVISSADEEPIPICLKAQNGDWVGCMPDQNYQWTCEQNIECDRKIARIQVATELEKLVTNTTERVEKQRALKEKISNSTTRQEIADAVDQFATEAKVNLSRNLTASMRQAAKGPGKIRPVREKATTNETSNQTNESEASSIELLQSQLANQQQEIDTLKQQVEELRLAVRTQEMTTKAYGNATITQTDGMTTIRVQ
ncbi:MAG: LamG-like jellyroll fold domain-containing protein, partial [Candidatus Woesearchaeota archaeon]